MALNLDGTFDGLKLAVASFLNRTDSAGYVDDLIKLGEDRVYEEVLSPDMITACSANFSTVTGVVAMPANFLHVSDMRVNVSGVEYPLKPVTLDELYTLYPKRSSTAKPEAYAVNVTSSGGDYYVAFGPYPDTAYPIKYDVYTRATVNPTTTGNTFFSRNQRLFLFAALAESSMKLGQDVRQALWEAKYVEARDAVNVAADRKRQGGIIKLTVPSVTDGGTK